MPADRRCAAGLCHDVAYLLRQRQAVEAGVISGSDHFGDLLAGALGVHELRTRLVFAGEAQSAPAHHGRGYLTLLTLLLGMLRALALALGLVARPCPSPSVRSTAFGRVRRI
jgi:hypothetical protein